LVIYSSPCNPTGSVYTHDELAALAKVIEKHEQLHIISDEIYEYINFNGKHNSIADFESIRDRVIIVNGFSKGFAMTGWRVGYIAAPLAIANACDKIQGQFTSGTCSISQKAALGALDPSHTFTEEIKNVFKARRDLILDLLSELPGIKCNMPQGAFYVFPDVSHYFGKSDGDTTIGNSTDFALYILRKAHVSLVMGEAFGNDRCVRISYAANEETLTRAVERIKLALLDLH
jgi:aspartate aminotransferase